MSDCSFHLSLHISVFLPCGRIDAFVMLVYSTQSTVRVAVPCLRRRGLSPRVSHVPWPVCVLVAELFMGWVDPWVRLGWVHYSKSILKFERILLMHLKQG